MSPNSFFSGLSRRTLALGIGDASYRLDKALDAAALNKWVVVDMKNDWKRICTQQSGGHSAPVLLTFNLFGIIFTVCRSSVNSRRTTCRTAKCAISGNSPYAI
jgi:hypothetical protein